MPIRIAGLFTFASPRRGEAAWPVPSPVEGRAVAGRGGQGTRRGNGEAIQQRHQLFPLLRLDDIIGIKPKGIIAGRVR